MLKTPRAYLLLFPLLIAGFTFGIIKLFQLRFDHGDVYPPSSSLRADPLGTKAFYESLKGMDTLSVGRLYEPLNKLDSGKGKTLFVLGTEFWALRWVSRNEADQIRKFLHEGGRIVIALQPIAGRDWQTRKNQKKEEADEEKKNAKKKDLSEDSESEGTSLLDEWHFDYEVEALATEEGITQPITVRRTLNSSELPESLPWYSGLYFTEANGWLAIYSRDDHPVVMARTFGKGSVVIASDSYLFSNEAMRKAREPALLAWFVGNNQSILFDEAHLGVRADPGIAALARKYRLHGLVLGLLLLAALFVWKNSLSLVPPVEDDAFDGRSAIVSGKDSSSGFINLLRRSIAPTEILQVCLDEWKKSPAHRRQKSAGLAPKIERLVSDESRKPPSQRELVHTYQTISAQLTEKNK